MYYIATFHGTFAFIKPWSAVRDGETFSMQFLTPSVIEGIEKKLFPELLQQSGIKKILRHKLTYDSTSPQQEVIQAKSCKKPKTKLREMSIILRNVLLNPTLLLAFDNAEDAKTAATQHICLCRNEDIMLPEAEIATMTEEEFNALDGYELRFGQSDKSFLVGYNRFDNSAPMYGWIEYNGNKIL